MRTTLTLEDDVAVMIEKFQKKNRMSWKDAVNTAIRKGLADLNAPPLHSAPFSTRSVDLGFCRLNHVDDVAEALALAEGEAFR